MAEADRQILPFFTKTRVQRRYKDSADENALAKSDSVSDRNRYAIDRSGAPEQVSFRVDDRNLRDALHSGHSRVGVIQARFSIVARNPLRKKTPRRGCPQMGIHEAAFDQRGVGNSRQHPKAVIPTLYDVV